MIALGFIFYKKKSIFIYKQIFILIKGKLY